MPAPPPQHSHQPFGRAPVRLAVTGTDTGVGKTLVTCALAAALRAARVGVAVMKPVETGVSDGDAGTDAERLRRAAAHNDGLALPVADVCPAVYAEALAPLIAAERAGRPLALATLDAARERLEARLASAAHGPASVGLEFGRNTGDESAALLVEGAGGLLVPLARDERGAVADLATLAARWALDLVVVAADRLGALNHTLLTVREAERRGIRVRLVVLNALRPAPADVAETTNFDALRGLLATVPVLPFPFTPAGRQNDLALLAAAGAPLARAALG